MSSLKSVKEETFVPNCTGVELSDHGIERIHNRVNADIPEGKEKEFVIRIMSRADRMMVKYSNNHKRSRWARYQQCNHGGSEFWEIDDKYVFVFGREYHTFMEKQYKLVLITILYHPEYEEKSQEYYKEKPWYKRLRMKFYNIKNYIRNWVIRYTKKNKFSYRLLEGWINKPEDAS